VAGPGVHICSDCVSLAARAIKRDQIPDFTRFDDLSDDELLGSLLPARTIADQTHDAVGQLIGLLRSRGVSWARIGGVLGVSRQAAWERYAGFG
jgi:ATP-dependent Clp protease ATP-binding subunit ClpX